MYVVNHNNVITEKVVTMIARKYALKSNVNSKLVPVKGQAKVVYDALKLDTSPALAATICDRVNVDDLRTRQDKLRVVLYYILVMKKQGLVESFEQTVETANEPEQLSLEIV